MIPSKLFILNPLQTQKWRMKVKKSRSSQEMQNYFMLTGTQLLIYLGIFCMVTDHLTPLDLCKNTSVLSSAFWFCAETSQMKVEIGITVVGDQISKSGMPSCTVDN